MDFNKENQTNVEKTGKKIGFVIMFLIFSIILYFILKFTGKIPESWTYLHIFLLAMTIP